MKALWSVATYDPDLMEVDRLLWLRWYTDNHKNPKWRALPPAWRCLYQTMCEIAGEQENAAIAFLPGTPFTPEQLADAAKIPLEDVAPALERLAIYEWVETREDCHYVTGYNPRQYVSDSSTERSRRHRETKKQVRNGDATGMQRCGNGDATAPENRVQSTDNNPDDDNAPEAESTRPPEDPLKASALSYITGYCSNWALAGDKWMQLLEAGEEQGWPLVVEAVKRTASAGVKDLKYPLRILQTWHEQNLTTVEAVLAADASRAADQKRKERGATQGRPPERNNLRWTSKDEKTKDPHKWDHLQVPPWERGAAKGSDPDPPKGDGRESA